MLTRARNLKEESNGYYEWKKCDTKIMNSVGKFNFMLDIDKKKSKFLDQNKMYVLKNEMKWVDNFRKA